MTGGVQVLAGDIGGTKTRLTVFEVRGAALEPRGVEETYASAGYASLDEIVRRYREEYD